MGAVEHVGAVLESPSTILLASTAGTWCSRTHTITLWGHLCEYCSCQPAIDRSASGRTQAYSIVIIRASHVFTREAPKSRRPAIIKHSKQQIGFHRSMGEDRFKLHEMYQRLIESISTASPGVIPGPRILQAVHRALGTVIERLFQDMSHMEKGDLCEAWHGIGEA